MMRFLEPHRSDLPQTGFVWRMDRRLAFDSIGRQGNRVVFFLHGTPMSRSSASIFFTTAMAEDAGVRIIAVDRPGCGDSTHVPSRQIADWPTDLEAVADHLDVETFSVLAYSGGSPYALATAAQLPERVRATVIVSGTAPTEVPGVTGGLAATARLVARITASSTTGPAAAATLGQLARRSPAVLAVFVRAAASSADRNALTESTMHALAVGLAHAQRQGPAGVAHDAALIHRHWGVFPSPAGPWHVWHGGADRTVSMSMARWLAERSPQGTLTVIPDEGHLSLLVHHGAEILALC